MSVASGYADVMNTAAATQAQQLQNQQVMDDRLSLAALGKAFGMAGPPAPPPAAAPPQAAPAPPVRVAGPMAAGPAPMGAGAPPGPPQASAAAAPPMANAAPMAAGLPARPQGPPQLPIGQMSLDQLVGRIRQANPGIEKRPDILMRAAMKGQQLLAPEGKQQLAEMQLNLKAQDVANKLERIQDQLKLGEMSLDTKRQLADQANNFKLQIAQLTQAGLDRRSTAKLEEALTAVTLAIAGRQQVAETNAASREQVTDKTVAGRRDVANINAAAKTDTQGVNQQFRAYAQQTAAINKRINEMLAGGRMQSDLKPEEKATYDELVKQRNALAKKAEALGDRAEKAGAGKRESFAAAVKSAGSEKPGENIYDEAAAAASKSGPEGAPDPATLPEGQTGTDASGVKWAVKDKKWVKAGGE